MTDLRLDRAQIIHPVIAAAALLPILCSLDTAEAGISGHQLLASSVEMYGPEFEQVNLAVKEFQQGRQGAAYQRLKSFCETHPDLPPAEILVALLQISENKLPQAYAFLEAATAAHPRDPEAYLIVADLAYRERRLLVADLGYSRARDLLDLYDANARRKQFLSSRVFSGSASLAESRGNYQAARDHLQEWIAIEPENPLAQGSLGRVSFHLGDETAARSAFARLSEMNENAPPVEIAMARLYTEANRIDDARTEIDAALKKHGEDIRTRLTVAEWALDTGFVELASENVAAALGIDAGSIGAQVLQARLARLEGDFESAESSLTAAVLKSPRDFSLSNEYARLLALSTDDDQRQTGLEYAERNYKSYRDRSTAVGREALMTYAWLLHQNGESERAEGVLHQLPNRSPVSKENAYYAAAIYASQGRTAQGKQALEAALSTPVAFAGRPAAEALLDELTANQ